MNTTMRAMLIASLALAFTACKKEEAALIVNEMVNLFVSTQTGTKKQEVAEKLSRLQTQRDRVQGEVDDADKSLDDVRKAWNLTDLDQSKGRYWRHTITSSKQATTRLF